MNKIIGMLLMSLSIVSSTINASQEDQLAQAIIDNNQKGVLAILNDGFDINASLNNKGETALHLAVQGINPELVELLIMRHAAVNSRDNDGNTPLILSIGPSTAEKRQILTLLLDNHADVNAQNNRGYTALMGAARRLSVDLVRLLLERKADVNLKDDRGATAFNYSRCNKGLAPAGDKVRKLLSEAGATAIGQTRR